MISLTSSSEEFHSDSVRDYRRLSLRGEAIMSSRFRSVAYTIKGIAHGFPKLIEGPMPLINSATWKSREILLRELRFHPSNPRLPSIRSGASDSEIVHEMCRRSDVLWLAKQIAEKGYFRNDRLIVVNAGVDFVVYEGNRRLCALKVLASPELAPTASQATYKRLSAMAGIKKSLKVAVEQVPSVFDAEVVMYSKHSLGKFMVPWEPLQQATFIVAKLNAGESIEDLYRYGLKNDEIGSARALVDLFRIARIAPLSDRAKALVDDPGKFPTSTVFERLVTPKKSAAALGLVTTDAGLVVNSHPDRFLPVLAKILDDAASGVIDTRVLNDEKRQLEYVASLNFSPGGGTFTADAVEVRGGVTTQRSTGKSSKAATSKRTINSGAYLFPADLRVEYDQEKLRKMVKEGKGLPINAAPHAAACLLRSVIEISLTIALKARRKWGLVPATNPKHGPSLGDMLKFVVTNPESLDLDRTSIASVEALVSRSVRQSKPMLDRIVHSPDVTVSPDLMAEIRDTSLPLLRKAFHQP